MNGSNINIKDEFNDFIIFNNITENNSSENNNTNNSNDNVLNESNV